MKKIKPSNAHSMQPSYFVVLCLRRHTLPCRTHRPSRQALGISVPPPDGELTRFEGKNGRGGEGKTCLLSIHGPKGNAAARVEMNRVMSERIKGQKTGESCGGCRWLACALS